MVVKVLFIGHCLQETCGLMYFCVWFLSLLQSECSQMETQISGVTVTSAKKRESLLNRAVESKSSGTPAKPVSVSSFQFFWIYLSCFCGMCFMLVCVCPLQVKLDFGSPKLPRRKVLEEDASVDFVFIPPETKETRVLTEHQKEVKRTKRLKWKHKNY